MKKYTILLIFVLISSSLFHNCKQEKINLKNSIYNSNREWKFSVKASDKEKIDTLKLNVIGDSVVRYILTTFDATKSDYLSDTMFIRIGFDDNNLDYIQIPSPPNSYLAFTSVVPSPLVPIPIKRGYSSESENIIEKTVLEEFRGEIIKGKLDVIGKVFYSNPIINDSCWEIRAIGQSKLGIFNAKYYFHEKNGFVYFNYDFLANKIEIDAISIK